MVPAVGRHDGGLAMDVQTLAPIYHGRLKKIPMVRGIVALIEAITLGIKSLLYSAGVSMGEEEEEISKKSLWIMVASAMVMSVGLFFIAPLFLAGLANPYIQSSLLFHLVEGIIRLAIFVAYIWLIGLIPDITSVFTYHGP